MMEALTERSEFFCSLSSFFIIPYPASHFSSFFLLFLLLVQNSVTIQRNPLMTKCSNIWILQFLIHMDILPIIAQSFCVFND